MSYEAIARLAVFGMALASLLAVATAVLVAALEV